MVVNPTTIQFQASADHAAVLSDGTPVVTRYDLRIVAVGAANPILTDDLGKPDPATDGTITLTHAAWFAGLPVGADYVATVVALGPGGEGESGVSDPFVRLAAPKAPGKPVLS